MATTNITIRMEESLKIQLQELLSELGMDMTTFFTLAAKQAVREKALPFQPRILVETYPAKAYQSAQKNTKYNLSGRAVIPKDDEWINESEWDDMFEQMKKEGKHEI